MVLLDGSKDAEIALPIVKEITAGLQSELILVGVSESSIADTMHLYLTYLNSVADSIRSAIKDSGVTKEVKIRREVLVGEPAHEILRFADQSASDLIILAGCCASTRGPRVQGNTAARIVRNATPPVLLIRKPDDRMSLSKTCPINRILVPLDGSLTGAAAIPVVERLASTFNSEIVLLHVLDPAATINGFPSIIMPYLEPRVGDSRKSAAVIYLESVQKHLQTKGLKVIIATDIGGAAELIKDRAKSHAVDLIAMSTHGRAGIRRLVLGSVTEQVLRSGDVPVLIVRAMENPPVIE